MGLFSTRWESEFEGHEISVVRNEFGRGFRIEWDGKNIAEHLFTWWGLGTLSGEADADGKTVQVDLEIRWGGFKDLDGICTVKVDGEEVPVRKDH